MAKRKPLLAFFGHHKCATTWLGEICIDVCGELGLRTQTLYDEKMFDGNLQNHVSRRKLDFIAYTNADYRYVGGLSDYKAFHVVRDPRDLIVSAYFSHLNSHPTHAWPALVDHREQLRRCSLEEGLLLEMEFNQKHLDEMRSWPSAVGENVLTCKMEQLTSDPYRLVVDVFSFLGIVDREEYAPMKRVGYLASRTARKIGRYAGVRLPGIERLPVERLLGIVWEHRFEKMSGGRKPGQEDPQSHYRKGIAGDWKNYFKEEHVREFKRRYNDLLLQYEYEQTPEWGETPQQVGLIAPKKRA